jgi:hypothetical protein
MASSLEVYMLALTTTMGQGIQNFPTTTSLAGTSTSGTTETRDAVLGNYTFNSVVGRRYQVFLTGLKGGSTVTADLYAIRIRNGGVSTPTSASTLVAESVWYAPVSGGPGQASIPVSDVFVAQNSGLQTLSVFVVKSAGTGVFTPLSAGVGRSLFVTDIGIF